MHCPDRQFVGMSTGMPTRQDRIIRYVNAFCPHCHEEAPHRPLAEVARLSGYLSVAEDNVWLVRGCSRHGKVVTLYDEDPAILEYLEQWTAPTKYHVPDSAGNYDPIPGAYLRGLGEMQTQHTCILLEEITQECNLKCPTCFADASPQLSGVASLGDVLGNVDRRLSREGGRLDVLMVSGGEPTIHPEFLDLLDRVVERTITRIVVNSNGIAISRDDRLLEALRRHNRRVEVYLQFDGFRRETHLHHRNADLRAMKRRAVERLSEAGVFTTLTMTASLGVNDDEIGDVVRYALEMPFVGGVSIQPQFGSGRSGEINPLDRLTHTGVLQRLGPQTGGLVEWKDLTALPCSHPHCCSVGYLIRDDGGEWRSLVSLIGHDRLKEHLGLVANRIADDDLPGEVRAAVKASLLGLLSEQSSLSHPTMGELIRTVCESCDLGLTSLLRVAAGAGRNGDGLRDMLASRVKRITVKPFMDMDTMIEERLIQCCVHVGTKSEADLDQCAPFCAVQAWPLLGRGKLSEVAGRRVESIPVRLRLSKEVSI
jgi:pyruvate-formate lyase-activating enzyme